MLFVTSVQRHRKPIVTPHVLHLMAARDLDGLRLPYWDNGAVVVVLTDNTPQAGFADQASQTLRNPLAVSRKTWPASLDNASHLTGTRGIECPTPRIRVSVAKGNSSKSSGSIVQAHPQR